MNILGVIPARGGSKEIKDKNLQKICGKSLLQICIENSNKSKLLTNLILSTDSDKIINHVKKFDVEVPFKRSKKLAGDKAMTFDVVRDALFRSEKFYNKFFDIIVILQPTTPFRSSNHIDKCINFILKDNSNACITVKKPDYPPHWSLEIKKNKLKYLFKSKKNFTRRQDAPVTFIPAGSVYALKKKCLLSINRILPNNNTSAVIVSEKEGLNIDNFFHLELARKLCEAK